MASPTSNHGIMESINFYKLDAVARPQKGIRARAKSELVVSIFLPWPEKSRTERIEEAVWIACWIATIIVP